MLNAPRFQLFLLYQSVVLSVIDYGLGLTTMTQTNLLNLDRVQNEAMRVTVENTKDTPTQTMRFMLDLPQCKPDRKRSRSKYTSVPSEIPTTHSTKPRKTQRYAGWHGASLGWVKQTTQYCKYAS